MARPVVVSELGAGRDVVLAPPMVAEDRMTGLRFSAGDDAALAAAVIRLFTFPERVRRAIGMRGREWVLAHFNDRIVAKRMLELYADIAPRRKSS
jgi:glycosyltransferase involved in cell wall biosynthesis